MNAVTTNQSIRPFAGIVLCGGQSMRMGQPKADLPCDGETLLARVARRLAEVATPVVVVAAENQALPPLPGEITIVRDLQPDRGPLEGLLSGLRALQARGAPSLVFLAACDLPLLKPDFVRRIVALLGDADAAVPRTEGQAHPLAAAYRASILAEIEMLLAADRRSMHGLLGQIRTRYVEPSEWADVDPQSHSLWNINAPDDWRRAQALMAEESCG